MVPKARSSKVFFLHRENAVPTFDERVFDDNWLDAQGYIVNSATAGRGASMFLNIDNTDLVLRHYRRGGMVRSISEKYYLWNGLQRTRAWREFAVLTELEAQGLPAPKPYACQVERSGLRYSASLITYYLPGVTLAERMCTSTLGYSYWNAIGATIKQFHAAGVDHADLNAHNILLDGDIVSLIDFDRAVIGSATHQYRFDKNLSRLKRSLDKIDGSGPAFYNDDCWASLISGYMQT